MSGAGGPVVYLWPCNVRAWECWCAVQTQWRVGMAGATGLDYAAVVAYLRDVEGMAGDELRECMAAVRAAEREVLDWHAEQAEE